MISVIVPVYNDEKNIIECVNSILAQSFSDIEIILVDDGSDDHSPIMCDELSKSDRRIKVIHQLNRGLSAARNEGVINANGDWILFVDSDDWIAEDMCEALMSAAEEDVDVILFGICKTESLYHPLRVAKDIRVTEVNDQLQCIIEDIIDPISKRRFSHQLCGIMMAQSKLYRASFLKEHNIEFNERVRVHEDIIYAVTIFEHATNVIFCDIEPYMYRYNPNSITNGFRRNYDMEISVFEDELEGLERKNVALKQCIDRRYIADTLILCKRYYCNPLNKLKYLEKKTLFYQRFEKCNIRIRIKQMGKLNTGLVKLIGIIILRVRWFFLLYIIFSIFNCMPTKKETNK